MGVTKVIKKDFDKKVLESKIPVLIDFYANWCGPCRMMLPIIEEVAESLSGKVNVVKINVDEEVDLAIKYKVSTIPTFLLIKNGQVVTSIVGIIDKKDLEKKLSNNI